MFKNSKSSTNGQHFRPQTIESPPFNDFPCFAMIFHDFPLYNTSISCGFLLDFPWNPHGFSIPRFRLQRGRNNADPTGATEGGGDNSTTVEISWWKMSMNGYLMEFHQNLPIWSIIKAPWDFCWRQLVGDWSNENGEPKIAWRTGILSRFVKSSWARFV